ncbi:MAG: hypothetical protein GVY17_02720 [Cyanobacteria bacterium]|nr:hypothetical protein [Cyanobacteria bacterium GSL.Bin21]
MKTSPVWLNFLSLLPATLLSLLTIAVAFLRFYDEQDFTILGQITEPRLWSNRLTVAALLVAVVNFGVEWNRRNRETNRLAEAGERETEAREREIQRDRAADEERNRADRERNRAAQERERANRERNRAAQERERATRRARIQNRWAILQIRYQLEASEPNRRALSDFLVFLQEYGE